MIELAEVSKRYNTRSGKRLILDKINFTIKKGERVGILGRNGAGKSTLIRLIAGSELPTSGSIERKMSVSWPLAFTGAFQGSLTGLDNLRFVCRVYGASFSDALPFVERFTDLGPYLREPVKKYSNGMRARLAFAISMAIEFDCFLIDEVISVGDSNFQQKCHSELFEKRADRAMIMVSHDPHMIREHCNRAYVLDAGVLRQFPDVDAAYEYYENQSRTTDSRVLQSANISPQLPDENGKNTSAPNHIALPTWSQATFENPMGSAQPKHIAMENEMMNEKISLSVEECVTALYQTVLARDPDPDGLTGWSSAIKSGRFQINEVISAFINSDEFRLRGIQKFPTPLVTDYHAPTALQTKDFVPRRVLLLGSCLVEAWQRVIGQKCPVDYVQTNNLARLPPSPPHELNSYDFQIVQIPLRNILNERTYGRLSYDQPAAYEELFERACSHMTHMIRQVMQWNIDHGILSFVCNFFAPQHNPLGRLLPRYDLRNIVYFIEQLNMRLYQEVSKFKNAHILDINNISAIYGRKYHQDDALAVAVHHGLLDDFDFKLDQNRIEPVTKATEIYGARTRDFISAIWTEAIALYRIVRQADAVKIVIMDLDDSLWRGIAAEGAPETLGQNMMEGWPVGLVEALLFLKKRGVLLAIVSKNSEERISDLWESITANRITMDDFAIKKINWRPKVDNVREVLSEANLLSKNAVFIDDNPVERASVQAAFADIRVLGHAPYETRRILLWSPETQVAQITDESARRTEMIQAQVQRESDSKTLSREEFLQTLNLKLKLEGINSVDATRFTRAFELLNKTNQFNTTGRRWTHEAMVDFFARDGRMYVFDVNDVYSNYGLVGVVLVRESHVEQWAMSCRVIGLDVEVGAMCAIANKLEEAGNSSVSATVIETEANFLCRDLFQRCGFEYKDGSWQKPLESVNWAMPPHIGVVEG